MPPNPQLSVVLQRILEQYPSPRDIGTEKYKEVNSDEELLELVTNKSKDAVNAVVGDRDPSFHVRPSMGQGDMADIPYIPIQLPEETQTTQKGIYVVYLFDTEAERLFLTLNQGSTEAERAAGLAGPPYSIEILARHAESYRQMIGWPNKFTSDAATLTESITVDGEDEEVNRASKYNAGTIAYREYGLGDLDATSEESITQDLNDMLDAYEEFIETLYSVPEFDVGDANVWKISPEGGKEPYWETWQENGIASIGFSKEATFEPDTDIDPPTPHNSPERQAYNIQQGISEGDIVVAGAPKSKIDVAFGIGRVTKGHYETMADIANAETMGSEDFEHEVFVEVDWYPFSDSGVAVNCLKDGKKLFHNWTVETFNAQLDHFTGAVARRMAVQELTESEDTLINEIVDHLGVGRRDTGRLPPSKKGGSEDEFETFSEWWEQHDDVIADTEALRSPDNLVFTEEAESRILSRIRSALSNDKHIILTGPPGTGKTKLARFVANQYVDDAHAMVTATADWSTFDTIGGYRPKSNRELEFHSGLFLDRFQEPETGMPKSEWLIIDELNRADIDKAFGSLLSALTGETIRLPFSVDDKQVTVIGDPDDEPGEDLSKNRYYIPSDWRLIGTMNTYDKTSLYQLSYAFMRRFAFIPVSVPRTEAINGDLIDNYAGVWFDSAEISDRTCDLVADLWKRINAVRPIGPAIVRDILAEVRHHEQPDVTDPLIMYVMPQLEGLTKSEQRGFVNKMQEFQTQGENEIDIDIVALGVFAQEYFDVDVDVDNTSS